ncbi:MAG: hypothetical protein ACPGSO_00660 [Vicingaceae bacterium]
MAKKVLDINSDAVVKFTNTLERIRISRVPAAIRGALNQTAFDVKTKTLLTQTKKDFIERRKNFFKAKSKVQLAKGKNIKSMKSIVGFIDGNTNPAVENLEQQEYGGKIGGRSFIPMNTSRVSSNYKRNVRKANRIGGNRLPVKKIGNKKSFKRQVYKEGVGKAILYRNTVFRIKSISKKNIKLTALYSHKEGRSVKVKPTGFMRRASNTSGRKIDDFYIKQIKRQLAFEKK